MVKIRQQGRKKLSLMRFYLKKRSFFILLCLNNTNNITIPCKSQYLSLIHHSFCQNLTKEVANIYRVLIGDIAKQKKIRGLRNADLAKMTGYSKSAIDKFMSGERLSESTAKALAYSLEIEI